MPLEQVLEPRGRSQDPLTSVFAMGSGAMKARTLDLIIGTFETYMRARGDIEGQESFMFTDSVVSETIAAKGPLSSKSLYDAVDQVYLLEMNYRRCIITSIHVTRT